MSEKTILVVEDNPLERLLLARILQRAGHQTATAANGQEGIDAIERRTFDLVLMDVDMPVMDGFEATGRIRQREQGTGQRQPILAVTAHAEWGDRERCLAAGMDGYVAKPVHSQLLLAAVNEAIADPKVCCDGPATSIGARILNSLRDKSHQTGLFEPRQPEEFACPADFGHSRPVSTQTR
jgi:CheY-like chemotaxis protein